MTIKNAILIGCFSCVSTLYGQTIAGEKYFKLYTNYQTNYSFQHFGRDTVNNTSLQSKTTTTKFGTVSPAINWVNQKGEHYEFELSYLDWTKTEQETFSQVDTSGAMREIKGGSTARSFSMAVRQEYIFDVFQNKEKSNFSFSIGASANPFFSRIVVDPKVSNTFKSSNTIVGLFISVVPRINYAIGEKWYLDVNVPLHLAQLDLDHAKVENPSFSASEQTSSTISFIGTPSNSSFRIGVGLKI